jgi:ketosteroid isomerase-like protein
MDTEQAPITGREDPRTLSGLRRALVEFYAAFNSRDLEALAQNWSNTSDAAMDNPVGGIVRGSESIRAVYERLIGGPSRINVEFFDYTLHEGGEIAYAVGRERGQLRGEVETLDLAIRTTRVFRLIAGRWRQVHHHGSMDDAAMLARYQKAVGLRDRPPSACSC